MVVFLDLCGKVAMAGAELQKNFVQQAVDLAAAEAADPIDDAADPCFPAGIEEPGNDAVKIVGKSDRQTPDAQGVYDRSCRRLFQTWRFSFGCPVRNMRPTGPSPDEFSISDACAGLPDVLAGGQRASVRFRRYRRCNPTTLERGLGACLLTVA